MDKLKKANLYRSALIPVSGKLVERYNKCLTTLGFSVTALQTFHIDGIGWSPEIAEEKEDDHYLSHGEANPHGIIISPLQQGKPVYMPYHTFDREMMKLVFNTHGEKIKDITRDSAICLDFDQGIDAFYEPLDVLKYLTVAIRFHLIDKLDQEKEKQLELVAQFNKDHNFIDERLHEKLLQSAKAYGDLRTRDLQLNTITFTTDSFYTKAFGGVFVLRDFIQNIIVFKDTYWHRAAIRDTNYDVLIYHIDQPELMDKLRSHMVIECDLKKAVETEHYQRIKKFEMFRHLKTPEHPIKAILNDPVLYKAYLNKLDIEARKTVMGVELYLEKIKSSNQYKIADVVDRKLYQALHVPHSSLETKHQDLIWKLLVTVSPKDVLFWYWYDKYSFYKAFALWDASFQDWVIETISNKI